MSSSATLQAETIKGRPVGAFLYREGQGQWQRTTNRSPSPTFDSKVDDLASEQGVIDQLPTLELDIPDTQIIKNLNNRIEDAQNYWNEPKGFDLKTSRAKNVKQYLGKQVDEGQLYRFQIPYNENEIFVAVETIVAYLTSQLPQPEVYPSQDTDQSRILATDLEKGLLGHSQKMALNLELESAIRNDLVKRLGILYLWYDPDYGENGEIRVSSINPEYVVIDKNATRNENPAFICLMRKDSVEQLCYRFPDKKADILKECGIKYQTAKQMSQIVVWRQVWLTHYDKGKPQEGCVSYFGDTVLAKYRNPNWLYADSAKNFMDMPVKPFIPLNYITDGNHWVDDTSPLEQASWIQEVLNKRGRQIMENADTANGFLVLSSDAMTMDDAENLTGDPNQKIMINTNGTPIGDNIMNIEGRQLPNYVVQDKIDLRNTVHSIMGTPPQMRGDDDNNADTLGENLMIKNQATGRQDLIVRAIDSAMDKYFKLLTQMMLVHYTEKHFMTVNGGDGDFDYITLHRDLIEKGMAITVKSGSTLPFDKGRQESIALNLAKEGLIDPLNLYKDLHMDNPQKRYDAWMKWKTQPDALARDALDELDDTTAYIDWIEIQNGEKVPGRDDASKEHILIHRKQMITDTFLKAKKSIQKAMIKHVVEEVNSLKLRTDLDAMAAQDVSALSPQVPIQPPPPPMPQPGMMPPGGGFMGAGTVPGGPPPSIQGVMGAPPPMAPMLGGAGQAPPVGGAPLMPLPNPSQPQTPPMGNPTAML